jgi:hypothetical protein
MTGRIPGGALVISLDFELHWGVRDKRSVADYRENLLGARRAVPAMLALFAEFGVRATWAIVGLLFAVSRREMLERLPARRPSTGGPSCRPTRRSRRSATTSATTRSTSRRA